MKVFVRPNRLAMVALIAIALASCSEKGFSSALPSYSTFSPGPAIPQMLTPTRISDTEVDSHIDASIPATDRNVIKNVMLHVPQIARQNVIYFSENGKIYVNHLSLKREIETMRPAQGLVSTYVGRDGRLVAAPPFLPKPREIGAGLTHPMYMDPPPVTTTGPYRRLYSDGAFHYTYASASIAPRSCPLTPTGAQGAAGDTGYIYSGGWSSSGQDTADAGFQYSAERDVFNLILKVASVKGPTRIDNVDWPCRGAHSIHFLITQGNLLTFATGYDSTGRVNSRTLVEKPKNYADWTAGTQVLKIMVSIAQIPELAVPTGIAEDGYSFGMNAGEPAIQLYNVGWGYCSENGNCNGPSQVFNPAWFQSVPDAGQVRTTLINPGPPNLYTETDGIQIRLGR